MKFVEKLLNSEARSTEGSCLLDDDRLHKLRIPFYVLANECIRMHGLHRIVCQRCFRKITNIERDDALGVTLHGGSKNMSVIYIG